MKPLVLALLATTMIHAADKGVVLYRASDLKAFQKTLAPKINAKKVATQQLDNWGNHTSMVAHREGSGEAELHKGQADLFIAVTGEATVVVGGTVVDGKETAPGEIRGPSIKDGQRFRLGPGDVLHIPANTAHQTLVDDGKQFTYFVMKVDSK